METTTVTKCKRPLIKGNSSFRLRSPSLNSVRLRRTFDLFDKNADGVITVDELSQALQLLGLDIDLPEIKSLVDSHIKPNNIGLEFEDFKSLHTSLNNTLFEYEEREETEKEYLKMKKQQEEEESDLSEAFKVFDENGDGYISAQELQVVLGKLGMAAEGKEICRVEAMILSADTNCDGRIDFFEFKSMMRSVVVRSA